MAGGKASKNKINLTERRQFAMELRKTGASYRDIAQVVRGQYRLSASYDYKSAQRDVMAVLQSIQRSMTETGEEVLALELLRLDQLQSSHWTKALDGDARSTEMVLRIMERRDALLGLSLLGPSWFAEQMGRQQTTINGTFQIVEVVKDYGKPEQTKPD